MVPNRISRDSHGYPFGYPIWFTAWSGWDYAMSSWSALWIRIWKQILHRLQFFCLVLGTSSSCYWAYIQTFTMTQNYGYILYILSMLWVFQVYTCRFVSDVESQIMMALTLKLMLAERVLFRDLMLSSFAASLCTVCSVQGFWYDAAFDVECL
jgi:hypothetical protein